MTATATRPAPTSSRRRKPKDPLGRGPSTTGHARVRFAEFEAQVEFVGLSNSELARSAEVSRTIVVNLLSGYRETVRPETAARLSKALGVSTRMLFELAVNPAS